MQGPTDPPMTNSPSYAVPSSIGAVVYGPTLLHDFDVHLFKQGNHFHIAEKLGSHLMSVENTSGTYFAVWAPNAEYVAVIGDFNGWNQKSHPLAIRWDSSGIWEGFIPGLHKGAVYKYFIASRHHGYKVEKTDPLALYWEIAPKSAAYVWDLTYTWNDGEWMKSRRVHNSLQAPMSIYEVHLGSWKRVPEQHCRFLTYRELAHQLPEYVESLGFTHVEFLPVTEHPFYASWGYQASGYFAPTSRYGTPQDFMYLIDCLHQKGIGVILDWVPSHFPTDAHALGFFDGTHLYEHSDPRKGYHPDWKSAIFNYGRNEVRNFLISSALFWLEKYHIDGLRVDAVASILYLDYSRKAGEWIPNDHGGKENTEGIHFLRRFNQVVYEKCPDMQTVAEESTAWAMVSRPVHGGGLGFGMKWNMGWMHDTLCYFSKDPIYRKHHHNELTFSIWYAFYENFILPLSHDEVVHGKGSLLSKMPGDIWQKCANLRALFGYMYMHPGKKLLFMGAEFGQWNEWNHEQSLDWNLLVYDTHQGIQQWVKDLNHFYRNEPALYEKDFERDGFRWVDFNDWEGSIMSFTRHASSTADILLTVCNLTPIPRQGYRIGVARAGYWKEVLNSDASIYGGSGMGNLGGVTSDSIPMHGMEHSLHLTLPPLSVVVFKNM